MTWLYLLVIIISVCHIYTKGNFKSARCKRYKKTWDDLSTKERETQIEDEFQSVIDTIRDNHKKREAGECVINNTNPIKQIYDQQLEEMTKPGYKNDPEWQALSKRVKETIKQNEIAESNEFDGME